MPDYVRMNEGRKPADILTGTNFRWLVTGAAGFIGSWVAETLLGAGQQVIGLDNFSTGDRRRLSTINNRIGALSKNFTIIEGDVRDPATVAAAVDGIDIVLHQAAIASVQRSFDDPLYVHSVNVSGTLTLLQACRRARVKRVVFASSSAVYGDDPHSPQVEENVGRPLSPYASSKLANEMDASLFARMMDLETVGLRYFNVYGPGQDPAGAYAAVIPAWIARVIADEPVTIFGTESITRDFCYVADVAVANLLAATKSEVSGQVFNIASGRSVTLGELFVKIRDAAAEVGIDYARPPVIGPARDGDVTHSEASVNLAAAQLGFRAAVAIDEGLTATVAEQAGRRERDAIDARSSS